MKTFEQYIKESSYDIGWNSNLNSKKKDWQDQYHISIRVDGDDEANVSGSKDNLEKFFKDVMKYTTKDFDDIGWND